MNIKVERVDQSLRAIGERRQTLDGYDVAQIMRSTPARLLRASGRFPRLLARAVRWGSAVGISVALATAGNAQTPAANSTSNGGQSQKQFTISEEIRFDAARQGPLLWVFAATSWPLGFSNTSPDAASVAAHVDKLNLRVMPVGSLTALVPTSMYVIEENPSKPDPYSGLRAEERLKVLMAMLTANQWRKAGSADGIGVGDLTEQQRPLFLGLLPDKVEVQHARLVPGNQPHSVTYDYQGNPQTFAPSDVHLRFVRQVQFGFMKPGSEEVSASGGPSDQPGDEKTVLLSSQVHGDVKDQSVVTAYGVPIMTVAQNRLKPGQLDFTAPALQRAIPIDDSAKTLGDLLAQVARVTGFDLVADRRLAKYEVAWRAAPGQSARAGDILKAICWSISGAFRKLVPPGGASTYLLTDDVHGIGARIAHLDEWAQTAERARSDALRDVVDAAAMNDPLSHVRFDPDDALALPAALQGRVDAAYRSERYADGPAVAPSELPPALQESVEQAIRFWADNNISVRPDRLRMNTRLKIEYKLPGDLVTEAPFSQNLDSQYLQAVAILPKKTPAIAAKTGPTPAPLPPAPLPESLRRRVVLAQLPEQSQAVADLLAAAKGAGFTEVWLHTMLNDPAATGRLNHAVAVGKKIGIAVGCSISLLRNGGMPDRDELNILGETGAEYAARKTAETPQFADSYRRLDGWCVLEPNRAARLLIPLARVPDLSALTLRATAAPGWAGETPGGDGIAYNGHLGYGVASRLACIRSEGYDPIDVAAYSYTLGVVLHLPMFESYDKDRNGPNVSAHDFWKDLCDYRLRENSRGLGVIYAALRQVVPDLSLYLGDRPSAYTDPHTSWYGLWDLAEHIPYNPVYFAESEGRAAAFATSPEPLRNRRGWNGDPVDLARALDSTAQDAAKNWRGLTFDLTGLKPVDVQRILTGLHSIYTRAAHP